MTVKVMSGEAAIKAPEPVNTVGEEVSGGPLVYVRDEAQVLQERRARSVYRPKKGIGFGSVIFTQFVISAVLGAVYRAVEMFGSGELPVVCERIAELFR